MRAVLAVWSPILVRSAGRISENCPIGTSVRAEWVKGDVRDATVAYYYPEEDMYHVDWSHVPDFCRDLKTGNTQAENRYNKYCQQFSWTMWVRETGRACGRYEPRAGLPLQETGRSTSDETGKNMFIGLGVGAVLLTVAFGLWKFAKASVEARHRYENQIADQMSGTGKSRPAVGASSPKEASFRWDKTLALNFFGLCGEGTKKAGSSDMKALDNGEPDSLWDMARRSHKPLSAKVAPQPVQDKERLFALQGFAGTDRRANTGLQANRSSNGPYLAYSSGGEGLGTPSRPAAGSRVGTPSRGTPDRGGGGGVQPVVHFARSGSHSVRGVSRRDITV